MRFGQYAILLWGSVVGRALSVGLLSDRSLPSSNVNCYTEIGPNPISVVETITRRNTKTVTLNDTISTVFPTVTITLEPATETTITTAIVTETITGDTVTDTFALTETVTNTIVDTITTVVTNTASIAQTSTVATSTLTVPPPDGFHPVADTVDGFPMNRFAKKKRGVHQPSCRMPTSQPSSGYPHRVVCKKTTTIHETVTATGETSTKTVTPNVVTETKTETVVNTSTEVPHAQITETIDETSTVTETSTDFQTQTETVTYKEETTHVVEVPDICGPDNFIGPSISAGGIVNIYNDGADNFAIYDEIQTDGAVACCFACASTEGCTGSGYQFSLGRCLLFHNNDRTCVSQSSNENIFTVIAGNGGAFIVTNSLCGYMTLGS